MSIFFAAPIDEHPDWDKVTNLPTANTPNGDYPASNLVNYDPTRPLVSTAQTLVVTWLFGKAVPIDVVSLIHTNMGPEATWSLETFDGSSWFAWVASSPFLAHKTAGETDAVVKKNMLRTNSSLHVNSTVATVQGVRITMDSGVAGKFPSLGRLFVGRKYVPSTGWQYGSTFDFLDLSKRDRTDRTALVLDPQKPIVTASVKMDFLNKTEMMDYIWDFNYWRGSARGILACLDVEDKARLQKNLLYATIAEGRRVSFDSYNTHSANWILESIA